MAESPHASPSRLARALTARPWVALGAVLAVTAASATLVPGLGFDSDYAALMGSNWPLRQELEAARDRLGAGSDVVIAVEGEAEARAAFGERLAPALAALDEIAWVDDPHTGEFFADRALWLVPIETLRELTDAIVFAHRELVRRAQALIEDPDAPDPWGPLSKLRQREAARLPVADAGGDEVSYLFAHPVLARSDPARSDRMLRDVERVIAAADPAAAGVSVRLGGKLPVMHDEQRTLIADVQLATQLAFVIVIALLVIATRRPAAPVVIGVPLVASLIVTLAVARLAFGQLTVLSGFILPALIGLGVDFGIHLYSRYLDGLADGAERVDAMQAAIDETYGGCFTSAATTAAAFAALLATDLQGFREVGILAAAGISLMFAITYVALPPLAIALSRRPGRRASAASLRLGRGYAIAIVACFAVAAAFALPQLSALRFHNDFREFKADSDELATTDALERRLGLSLSPAAFIASSRDEAAALQHKLDALDRVKASVSMANLVPDRREERAALLATLSRLLGKMVTLASDEDRGVHELEGLLALAETPPWTTEEIPETVRRRLVLDGGDLVVLAFPARTPYTQDQLEAWVTDLESVGAPAIDERRMSVAVLGLLEDELPDAVAFAAIAVFILIVLRFRRPAAFAPIVIVVGLAVPMLLGLLAACGVTLHAYNVIALPAIIGVGVDNAIHIQHAHLLRGPGSIPDVLATTGRAAVLASATTAAGFGIDVIAAHPGVRSLGWVAAGGIAGMLVVTTAVLPAVLHLLDATAARSRSGSRSR